MPVPLRSLPTGHGSSGRASDIRMSDFASSFLKVFGPKLQPGARRVRVGTHVPVCAHNMRGCATRARARACVRASSSNADALFAR